jgi:CRISPR-associated protein Cst1
MVKVHWTGHPFVDAGLAALAAAAQVEQLEAITPVHLQHSTAELQRVLLSKQALGVGVEKAFARSALSQLFPNSELVNPSNWKGQTAEEKSASVQEKFRDALTADLQRAQWCLESDYGSDVCFSCGEAYSTEAMGTVRKDKLPLLEGIVNFVIVQVEQIMLPQEALLGPRCDEGAVMGQACQYTLLGTHQSYRQGHCDAAA